MRYKFRAWDKETNKFLDLDWNDYYLDIDVGELYEIEERSANYQTYMHKRYLGNVVLQQFTGLLDRNGKEIYEGDILRFPPKDWREERDFIGYEVFYHDNDCADNHVGFQMNRMRFYGNLCGGECRAKMLPKYTSQMEIIANIYENPELINS